MPCSCVGENHGKNGLLCTDLYIRHIWQSLVGECGNVWSCLKTGLKWLRNALTGNSLNVSPISSYVSSCFIYCFASFLGISHVSLGVSPYFLFRSYAFISTLMIVVILSFFNSIHRYFVCLRFQQTCLWRIGAMKKEKLWTTCTFFLFCFVRFKFYCFCL